MNEEGVSTAAPRVGVVGGAGTKMRAETASAEASRRLLTKGNERFMEDGIGKKSAKGGYLSEHLPLLRLR